MFLKYKGEYMPYQGHLELLLVKKQIEFKTISSKKIIIQYKTEMLAQDYYIKIKELIRLNNNNPNYELDLDALIDEADEDIKPNPPTVNYPYVEGIKPTIKLIKGDTTLLTENDLKSEIKIIYNEEGTTNNIQQNISLFSDEGEFTPVTNGTLLTASNIVEELKNANDGEEFYLEEDIVSPQDIIINNNITLYGNKHTLTLEEVQENEGTTNFITVLQTYATFKDITIKLNKQQKSVIHLYDCLEDKTILENVTLYKNGNNGSALVVNGAKVEFLGHNEIYVSEDAWQGIDVDDRVNEEPSSVVEFDKESVFKFYNKIILDYNGNEIHTYDIDKAPLLVETNEQTVSEIPGYITDENGVYFENQPNPNNVNIILKYFNDLTEEEVTFDTIINNRGKYTVNYLILDEFNNKFEESSKILVYGKLIFNNKELDEELMNIRIDLRSSKGRFYTTTPEVYYEDYEGGIHYVKANNKIKVNLGIEKLAKENVQYTHPINILNGRKENHEYIVLDIYIHGNIELNIVNNFKKVYKGDNNFDINEFINENATATVKHVIDESTIDEISLSINSIISPSFDINKTGVYTAIYSATDNFSGIDIKRVSLPTEIIVIENMLPVIKSDFDCLKIEQGRDCCLTDGIHVYDNELGKDFTDPIVTVYDSESNEISATLACNTIGRYKVHYDVVDDFGQSAETLVRDLLVYGAIQYNEMDDFNLTANGEFVYAPELNLRKFIRSQDIQFHYINADGMKLTIEPKIIINGLETDYINLNNIRKNEIQYVLIHPEAMDDNYHEDEIILLNNVFVHGNVQITAYNYTVNRGDTNFDINEFTDNGLYASVVSILNDGTLSTKVIDIDTITRTCTPDFDINKAGIYRLQYSITDDRFDESVTISKTISIRVV